LAFLEAKKDGVGGADGLFWADEVVVSPDDRHLYVSGSDGVGIYARSATTNQLSLVDVYHPYLSEGIEPYSNFDFLDFTPDGSLLLSVGYYDDGAAILSRNADSGRLSFIESVFDGEGRVDGLYGPRSCAVSPEGKDLYVCGSSEHAVAVFLVAHLDTFQANVP
jgi:6-phosphogluconolactonase (cycloisomerase 2 family)